MRARRKEACDCRDGCKPRGEAVRTFEKLGVSTRVELVLYWLQQQSNAASAEFVLPPKAVVTAN